MDRMLKALGVSIVITLTSQALIVTPASAISADLAKKCRAMAIKAHPPQLAGTKKGTAQAERTFYKQCITNDGAPPNDGTQNNTAPQSK